MAKNQKTAGETEVRARILIPESLMGDGKKPVFVSYNNRDFLIPRNTEYVLPLPVLEVLKNAVSIDKDGNKVPTYVFADLGRVEVPVSAAVVAPADAEDATSDTSGQGQDGEAADAAA